MEHGVDTISKDAAERLHVLSTVLRNNLRASTAMGFQLENQDESQSPGG